MTQYVALTQGSFRVKIYICQCSMMMHRTLHQFMYLLQNGDKQNTEYNNMQSRQMTEAQFHEGQIKYMDFLNHRLLS